ncbi:hypothetical protein [Paraburkholderia sp. J76]|uniref:hypothetical protein n=1 Tax=Paraburkholderia sp. J76 TaxID=2805439 RepID=UPI002ABDEDA0|nr:hypothetical protein [Paraburkholderia sp. J76]
MSAQMTSSQSFPTQCNLCGGALYQSVDSCPYCGTDRPFDTVVHARPKPALRVLDSTAAPMPGVPRVSPAGTSASSRPSVQADYLHHYQLEDQRPFWQTGKGFFTKCVLLVLLILAMAYAAFLLFGTRHKQESAFDAHGTFPAAGTVSSPPTPNPRVTPQFKDVPDSLRAARASLAENNLSDASAAVNAALSHDANNEDARALQRDIGAREKARDSALQSAEQCATQLAWDCVQQQASAALAIDSSSQHAQSLKERAILAAGWPPLRSPLRSPDSAAQESAAVPLPRGASTVPLPSSRDWGAVKAAASKAPPASTPPIPLPGTANIPANADTATAAANQSATASAPDAAGNDNDNNGADAQQRAIRQLGWKHATSTEDTH